MLIVLAWLVAAALFLRLIQNGTDGDKAESNS